jgi:N-acetylglucosamine kinase-like BadF-type ATPase
MEKGISTPAPHILKVDVGGTKTHAASTHVDRTFVADLQKLAGQLKDLTEEIPPVDQLLIGIRGVWTPAEKSLWKKKLNQLAEEVVVLSDVELAHRCVFGETDPGILLNAGTGSIAFGRNKTGKTARAGGVGSLLGDEGSGFWIGKMWLAHQMKQTGDWRPSREYATRPDAVRAVAALAKPVLERSTANAHSPERRIVRQAAAHLVDLVNQVRKELKIDPRTPVHVSGGMFDNDWFRKEVLKRI